MKDKKALFEDEDWEQTVPRDDIIRLNSFSKLRFAITTVRKTKTVEDRLDVLSLCRCSIHTNVCRMRQCVNAKNPFQIAESEIRHAI